MIKTGTRTTKGVVGLDLTRLLIGSEGTLAVITEATLKLTPLAEGKRTLRAIYQDMHSAAEAVSRIMAQPVIPCALEFLDGAALDMIRDDSDVDIPQQAGGLLMIEIDGSEACLDQAVDAIRSAAKTPGCLELSIARNAEEVAALWNTRKALSPALRKIAPKKINEDVVVPVSRIPELIDGLGQLSSKYAIKIVNFGHAGNGNIHVNLLVNPDDPRELEAAESCLDEVFTLVLALDGSLSGEHGIGLVKRDFVAREIDAPSLQLMHQIKASFDPRGILNPGKTLPDI
jgi:D-lactate dehydrogenase